MPKETPSQNTRCLKLAFFSILRQIVCMSSAYKTVQQAQGGNVQHAVHLRLSTLSFNLTSVWQQRTRTHDCVPIGLIVPEVASSNIIAQPQQLAFHICFVVIRQAFEVAKACLPVRHPAKRACQFPPTCFPTLQEQQRGCKPAAGDRRLPPCLLSSSAVRSQLQQVETKRC